MIAMPSNRRSRYDFILALWMLAATFLMFQMTLQYTTFGASAPRSLNSSPAVRGTSIATHASWREPANPFYNSNGERGVQARGAWAGVFASGALVVVAQLAAAAPALAAIALTALLIGIAAREGRLIGGGLNFSGFPSFAQRPTLSSWSAPRATQSYGQTSSVSFNSSAGMNSSWQNSLGSSGSTSYASPSSAFSWNGGNQRTGSTPNYGGASWMPGSNSYQNSWQQKVFGWGK